MARIMHLKKYDLKGAIKLPALSQLNMLKDVRLAVFILPALIVGCAGLEEGGARRYFFPPLPDTPRVEYIGVYASQHSFPKTTAEALRDSLAGQAEPKQFDKPWGIASDSKGKVYVTDTSLSQVLVYDFNAKTVVPLGGEEGGPFLGPVGVAVDGDENVYVSDTKKNRVFAFSKDGKPLFSLGEEGALDWPGGMAVDNRLKRLYVVNTHKSNVAVFDLSGKHLFSFSGRGNRDGYLNLPTDVDIDSKGNIVVADSMNARVQIFDPDGKFIKKFGQRGDGLTDFHLIKGIAVDKKTDNIYVVDGRADRVLIFSKGGEPLLTFGYPTSVRKTVTPGGFLVPQDINIDENGTIYVVDSLNRRFQVFQIVDEEWLKRHPIEK